MELSLNKYLPEVFFFRIKKFIIFVTLFLSVLQIFISSFDSKVIIILFFINLINFINLEILLKRKNIIFYLVPVLFVLAINFFYLLFPIFIKTFFWESILTSLENGFQSFSISCIYVFTSTLSLIVFIKLTDFEKLKKINRDFLTKINIFKYVDFAQNIRIFIILLLIKFYLTIYENNYASFQDFGNIFLKFFFGFESLFYLPIIYCFFLYFNSKSISKKKFLYFLLINILFSIFFAILKNSRTEIFEMVVIISFCFLLFILSGRIIVNKKKIFYTIFLLIAFFSLIENISKKILDLRSIRYEISSIELFKLSTGLIDMDHHIVNKKFYRNEDTKYINYTGYNILDRFTPIKYLDRDLYNSNYLGHSDIDEFKSFSLNKLLIFLPQNLINIFIKDFDKKIYQVSTGSKIERLAFHNFGGDFNKGSFIVELILITNSYFFSFLIIAILYLFFFYLCSIFQKLNFGKIILSPFIILLTFELIYLSQSDSLSHFFNIIIRQPLQMILLINIILFLTITKKKIN